MKVLLLTLFVVFIILTALYLYLALRYPQVNPGLRPLGFLISACTRYDSVKGLKGFSFLANHFMPLLFSERDKDMDIQKCSIPGRDKNNIPLVIYRPQNAAPDATGLLWLHGGGYAIGTPAEEKSFLKPMVLKTNTVAIIPDYRLSGEAPYPAAFCDCLDALLWTKQNAKSLGINDSQLFVGGESAGGGLCIALALYARDSGAVNLAFQLPIYPMINDRMDTPSMIGNTGMLWDEKRNRAAWQLYLGDLFGTDDVPVYAAPAREKNYSELPPAYTFVGTLDPFYDETLRYIQLLRDAGIPAKCDVYEEAFHGFDVIPSKISKKARAKLYEEYCNAVALCYAPQKDDAKDSFFTSV